MGLEFIRGYWTSSQTRTYFLYGIFILIAKITGLIPVQGWATIMIVILFVSAFQMIGLGIIGEYVWRALDAARNRPNFIVEKVIEKTEA